MNAMAGLGSGRCLTCQLMSCMPRSKSMSEDVRGSSAKLCDAEADASSLPDLDGSACSAVRGARQGPTSKY